MGYMVSPSLNTLAGSTGPNNATVGTPRTIAKKVVPLSIDRSTRAFAMETIASSRDPTIYRRFPPGGNTDRMASKSFGNPTTPTRYETGNIFISSIKCAAGHLRLSAFAPGCIRTSNSGSKWRKVCIEALNFTGGCFLGPTERADEYAANSRAPSGRRLSTGTRISNRRENRSLFAPANLACRQKQLFISQKNIGTLQLRAAAGLCGEIQMKSGASRDVSAIKRNKDLSDPFPGNITTRKLL